MCDTREVSSFAGVTNARCSASTLSSKLHLSGELLLVQVSIAKQLKSTLGIEDSTKIGFLVHVSFAFIQRHCCVVQYVQELCMCLTCDCRVTTVFVYSDLLLWSRHVLVMRCDLQNDAKTQDRRAKDRYLV